MKLNRFENEIAHTLIRAKKDGFNTPFAHIIAVRENDRRQLLCSLRKVAAKTSMEFNILRRAGIATHIKFTPLEYRE